MNIKKMTKNCTIIFKHLAKEALLHTFVAPYYKKQIIMKSCNKGKVEVHESNALKATRNEPKRPIKDKKVLSIINEAIEIFSHEVSPETMEIINRNLTTINEKKADATSFVNSLSGTDGVYYSSNHSIEILLDDNSKTNLRKVISHELMHAASSYNYNGQKVCGFHQNNIGGAINEGYTELLVQRYFCKNIPISSTYVYLNFNDIAEMIELIIGKDKMQELYFQADLKGLISELSKYQEEEKVKQFIIDLDTILSMKKGILKQAKIPEEDIIIGKLYNRVRNFLYNTYEQKANKDNTNSEEITKFFNLYFSKMCASNSKIAKLIKNYEKYREYDLKTKTDNIKTENTRKLVRRRNGYVNIISISLVLLVIIVISILIAYFMIKK